MHIMRMTNDENSNKLISYKKHKIVLYFCAPYCNDDGGGGHAVRPVSRRLALPGSSSRTEERRMPIVPLVDRRPRELSR